MTGHDEAFAQFVERKRANESSRPPKVTWRRVDALTGGGWSGLGPAGVLVFVSDARAATPLDADRGWQFPHVHDYGRIDGKTRTPVGLALNANDGKRQAALLVAHANTTLSDTQRAILTCLCAGGRASASTLAACSGAGPSALTSLVALGLMTKTAAGAREPLYHLTETGRALVCEAVNDDSQGGPNMTDETLTENEPAAAATETAAPAPTAAKRRGRKSAEMAAVAAGDVEDVTGEPNAAAAPAKQKAGANDATKELYKKVCAAVKATAGRGAKTEEKQRYLRVGVASGKTVAYVNFPSGKHVRVCVVKAEGGGELIHKVIDDAGLAAVVADAEARVEHLKNKAKAAA